METDLRQYILDDVKKFITFENPNNFDEYFSKTLPDQSISLLIRYQLYLCYERTTIKKIRKNSRKRI